LYCSPAKEGEVLIQGESIHDLLSQRVELLRERPDAIVDIDAEIDLLLTALPQDVALVREDLRVEMARLATDRGLTVLLAHGV